MSDVATDFAALLQTRPGIQHLVEESHCTTHSPTELRRRILKNGTVRYEKQCLTCGSSDGAVKADTVKNGAVLPAYDDNLADEIRWARDARRDELWKRHYNIYLQSPEWQQRRQAVIKRDQGLCQGCLTNLGRHVHHQTYNHVGAELLFELILLCEACHEKCHG